MTRAVEEDPPGSTPSYRKFRTIAPGLRLRRAGATSGRAELGVASAMVHLGPFRLIKPVGRGGMASVWKARHEGTDIPVAVKVLERELDPRARTWFRREVRGQARLRHPGIAMVLDYGEVPESVAAESELVAGAPWLAMEYASAGPVHRLRRTRWPWRLLRELLLSLLDALSHAHARGVIHRDVKLANLLLASPQDQRPGLKLCDFGIAWSPTARAGAVSSGTPRYMAPEQLAGLGAQQGPWTDLYGVGVVAWRLGHGRFPHEEPIDALLAAKRRGPPRAALPPGFPRRYDLWLRRMLAGSPDHRYALAADAARALAELEDPEDAVRVAQVDLELFRATGRLGQTEPGSGVQPRWQRDAVPPLPVQLTGAGLGVWSIRSPELVGRRAARNALWEELRAVDGSRRPRAVVVRGPTGIGKSRLLRWLGERAEEVGAAHGWTFGAGGLDGMVRDGLGLSGLAGVALREGVASAVRRLGGTDVDGATARALVSDGGVDPDTGVRVRAGREQRAAAVRLIQLQAARRALVVCCEDGAGLREAVLLAEAVLDTRGDLPVVVLVEVRDEWVATRSLQRALLENLAEDEGCRTVRLRPLGSRERVRMVRDLLPLEPELEGQVIERSGGNPMLAVTVVRTLLQRNALISKEAGFGLAPGRSHTLPLDIAGAWRDRVDGLLATLAGGAEGPAGLALERAALLGLSFDRSEWTALSGATGSECDALHEALLDQRLWLGDGAGRTAWAHGMLREAVVARAERAGRLEAHHRALADGLRPDPWEPTQALRELEHRLALGELAELARPLVRAASALRGSWSRSALTVWMRRIERSVAALDPPEQDPLWLELVRLRVRLRYYDGDMRTSLGELEQGLDRALRHGHMDRVWDFRYDLIVNLRLLGRPAEALEMAEALVETAGSTTQLCTAWDKVSRCHLDRGQLDLAREAAERATDLLEALDAEGQGSHYEVWENLGNLHMVSGEYDAARAAFERTLAGARDAGSLHGMASCWNSLGETARMAGALDEAERCYQRAIEHWEPLGATNTALVSLNLGMVAVARGDFTSALRHARSFDLMSMDAARRWLGTTLRALRATAFAGLGQLDRAEKERVALAGLVAETGRCTLDEPWLLERAARALRRRGQDGSAFLADAALAWERVGRPEEAARVRSQA